LLVVEREVDLHRRERDRMTEGDQLGSALGRLDPGDARDPQDVALFRGPGTDLGERRGQHADRAPRDRHPVGLGLASDVNHTGRAAFVEVGQLFRHN
jgi:hypothetical protein